jgi:tetratricopeptide (TPR) repeat protein
MLTALALLWTPSAYALTCSEIMNMVNVNVPTAIVIQTIEESGDRFSSDDIRCLTNEGAPAEVIAAAKGMMKQDTPAEEAPAAPAEEEEAGGSDFDRAEGIGDKTGTSRRELEDKGGDEEEDTGADPGAVKKIQDAADAKKYLTATAEAYKVLDEGAFPDKESKVLYLMGKSLFDMQMYHGAQYYFIEVLKKGPQNPYFKYALPKLVTISKFTGDDSDLQRIVAKIPPEEFPKSARNQLFYLLGVRLYEQEKLTEARKYFDQVSEKSDLYTRSQYFVGVIYNKQGKLKSAVKAFSAVVQTAPESVTQQEAEEIDRLRELSILNIARVYYSIERFDEAKKYYDTVPRTSRYWPQSLFENAWTNFMLSDLNLTLGQLLTISSPFYGEDEFIPEATILRSLTFFNLCEYDDVDRLLLDFDAKYRPMHAELKDVLKQYSTDEGKKLADQAFERYFEEKGDTTLPKALFSRALRNNELAGIVQHLKIMDQEEELIASQKQAWQDTKGANSRTTLADHLRKQIGVDRERLKRRAGLLLLQELATINNHLGDLLAQAEIIRFEVVDARRADYVYRGQGVDLKDTSANRDLDFSTSRDRIYWPFNGEFWQDELGYYFYTEQGSCK